MMNFPSRSLTNTRKTSLARVVVVALLVLCCCFSKNVSASHASSQSSMIKEDQPNHAAGMLKGSRNFAIHSKNNNNTTTDGASTSMMINPPDRLRQDDFKKNPTRLLSSDRQWVTFGNLIKGKFDMARTGSSVATSNDGNFIIVGSPIMGIGGYASIFQYKQDTKTWEQVGEDIIAGEGIFYMFGGSVDINYAGDVVIIGHSEYGSTGSRGACVYQNINRQWVQKGQKLGGSFNDKEIGGSVAISGDGNKIIVYGGDDNAKSYEYNEDEQRWKQFGGVMVGKNNGGGFGFSLDMDDSGDFVIIGGASSWNDYTGYASVYRLINGEWVQQGQDLEKEGLKNRFGFSVAIASGSGRTRVIVGGFKNDFAVVHEYNEDSEKWEQVGEDILGETSIDNFGYSVDMSSDGDVVIVGGPVNGYYDDDAPGHARVYREINGQWVQQGEDIDGDDSDSSLGYSVAISGSGKKAIIGAPHSGDKETDNQWGHVRAFKFQSTSSSTEPSMTPSHSSKPSSKPIIVSSQPSLQPSALSRMEPTQSPSISSESSPTPSAIPTHPTSSCYDSPLHLLIGRKYLKVCTSIATETEKFCNMDNVKSHCPITCGACEEFGSSDSTGSFIYEERVRYCDKWLRGMVRDGGFEMISEYCQIDDVNKTCRKTCNFFVRKCE